MDAPVVVNCTGLGARELVPDPAVRPVRGQLVVVENPGLRTWLVSTGPDGAPTYLFPQPDRLVLGGTAEEDAWSREPDPAVAEAIVRRCAALRPEGDVVHADVAREAANDVVDRLRALGAHREGTVHLEPVRTWISAAGYAAERRTPGSSADSVVWAEVTQQAYADSELNWTYLTFMTLATVIAGIATVPTPSPILPAAPTHAT